MLCAEQLGAVQPGCSLPVLTVPQAPQGQSADHCKPGDKTQQLIKLPSMPLTEHSDKSSQDRLSQLDVRAGMERDDTDCWPASAQVSSRLAVSATPFDNVPAGLPVRVSPRRVRVRAPLKEELSYESSPRDSSCATDPDWSLDSDEQLFRSRHPRKQALDVLARVAGKTSEEKAASARSLGEAALKDAEIKAKRAAKLILLAQRMATEASRAAKRRRISHLHQQRSSSCDNILIGARLAVYWPDDKAFYKGRVVDANDDELLHKIVYDDEVTEWLSLADERFRLLTPRAHSAGCTTELMRELETLEAEGLAAGIHSCGSSSARLASPAKEAAVGWRVIVCCRADGMSYEGQVLAYKAATGLHHVLYSDGEDEWLSLVKEQTQWLEHHRGTIPAGLLPGQEPPIGKQAVGWRIAVYWKTDQTFYPGLVQAFDATTGRHHVLYADGDEEHLCLSSESLKWLLPPPFRGGQDQRTAAADARQRLQVAGPPAGKTWPRKLSPARCGQLGSSGIPGRLTPKAKKYGSTESISAMLDRVEADERALMSDIMPPTVAFEFGTPVRLESQAGESPLGNSPEGGGSSTLPLSPTAQTAHLLQLNPLTDAAPPSAHQAIRASTCAPAWQMGPPFSRSSFPAAGALPRSRPAIKSESDLHRSELLKNSSLDLETLDRAVAGSLLGGVERACSLPIATPPSLSPLLDGGSALTEAFGSSTLLLGEDSGNLQAPLESDSLVGASDSLEMGGDFLDILMDIPPIESSGAAWWRLSQV